MDFKRQTRFEMNLRLSHKLVIAKALLSLDRFSSRIQPPLSHSHLDLR